MVKNKQKEEEVLKKKLAIVEEKYKNSIFSRDNFILKLEKEIKEDFFKKDDYKLNSTENIFNEPIRIDTKNIDINKKIIKEEQKLNDLKLDNKDIIIETIKPNSNNSNIITNTNPKTLSNTNPKPNGIMNKTNTEIVKSSNKPTERKELIGNIINQKPNFIQKNINTELISKKDKELIQEIKYFSEKINKIKIEMSRVIVGQEGIINGLLRGLICNGHVLLEGVPGIAKTLTVRALGEVTGCSVKRVQFTVDLLPTDITGITSFTPGKGFEIIKGPIFANFIIADEINRSPPKTQSALIEAMQEKQVTIGKTTFQLPNPFFVMATKNPLENVGVYTLPEAQVDRFLFNIIMNYPDSDDEKKIMEQNSSLKKFEDYKIKPIISPKEILNMQELVKKIYLSDNIKDYILEIVKKTRDKNFKYSECIAYGASPRASIALFIASKARALMEGRTYVIPDDVREVSKDVLRHRLILTYKSTIMNLTPENIINEILNEIPV